jgi:protein TonB
VTADVLSSGALPTALSNSQERFQFCLFIAILLHAIFILAMGFTHSKPGPKQASLEVTMAIYQSEHAPDKADFIAQANQLGSGSLDKAALPSTTELADFHSNKIQEITPDVAKTQKKQLAQKTAITAQAPSPNVADEKERINREEQELTQQESTSLLQRNLEIASLEARLAQEKQRYAKRPRKKQLTAASTQQADDAAYLDAWRTRVETVGNQDYETLGVDRLYGELRLMVALNADGTINNIQILKSSGHKAIDDAAIKVVRKAAPFDAFPPELRKETDILEIIRTWRFEKGQYISSF